MKVIIFYFFPYIIFGIMLISCRKDKENLPNQRPAKRLSYQVILKSYNDNEYAKFSYNSDDAHNMGDDNNFVLAYPQSLSLQHSPLNKEGFSGDIDYIPFSLQYSDGRHMGMGLSILSVGSISKKSYLINYNSSEGNGRITLKVPNLSSRDDLDLISFGLSKAGDYMKIDIQDINSYKWDPGGNDIHIDTLCDGKFEMLLTTVSPYWYENKVFIQGEFKQVRLRNFPL